MGQALRDLGQTGAKRTGEHKGGVRQKYILDDPSRQLLLAVYANPDYGSVGESIDYLVSKLHWPRTIITHYAQDLGLSRTRDDYWTPEEIVYLEKYYQEPAGRRASVKSIAQHLGRSVAAVRIKAKRMKFRRVQGDTYSIRGLADALGCDWHKIERWIDLGWLVASWELRSEKKQRSVKPEDIRQFIIANPSEIDHRRADWIWLLIFL